MYKYDSTLDSGIRSYSGKWLAFRFCETGPSYQCNSGLRLSALIVFNIDLHPTVIGSALGIVGSVGV